MKRMPHFCKNIALPHGKLNFIHLQKFKCDSLLSKLPIMNKRFEIIFRK